MGKPFETDGAKKIRTIDLVNEDRTYSGFSYFMDGSRRTYKIGDMVLESKKIYPVVVAQIRAGCTERNRQKKLHTHGSVQKKNLLLSDKMNEVDFQEVRQRILKTQMANLFTSDYSDKKIISVTYILYPLIACVHWVSPGDFLELPLQF